MQHIHAHSKTAALLSLFVAMLMLLVFPLWEDASAADVCPGKPVGVTTADFTPFIRLSVGGKEGWFLIDTASAYSYIDTSAVNKNSSDKYPELNIVGFPYVESEHFLVTDLSRFPSPRGEGLLGLIGQNILSLVSVQFQYDADSTHLVVSSDSCSPLLEGNPDFAEIKQTGYYVRDRQHLNPGEPNIPRLYVNIGTTKGVVYLDSGNSDGAMLRPTGAITMNDAFVSALKLAGTLPATTEAFDSIACPAGFNPKGGSQRRWSIESNLLEVTDGSGDILFQYYRPIIEAISKDCSDIASNENPLGTIGASYFQRWGTVVLDAPSERVWVRVHPLNFAPKLPASDTDRRPDNGIATYLDAYGSTYKGNFVNGVLEGHCTQKMKSGVIYEGNCHLSLREGQGEQWLPNNYYYDATFHNNHPQKGFLRWHNGDTYEGGFDDNEMPSGTGTITWKKTGDSYTGPFSKGVPDGLGTYTIAASHQTLSVLYRDGVLHRQ